MEPIDTERDAHKNKLRNKVYHNNFQRKEEISNKTNFRDISNPFSDYSMTLQTLKKQRHDEWLVRKEHKQKRILAQIGDMEKKIEIYKRYRDEAGITFSKAEREKVFKSFDH